MTKYDDHLTAELRARAEDSGGHPISLADVKTKATSIRRRRNGLAATAVAGVLAVAVSAGATAIRANTNAGDLPPTQKTTDNQPDTVAETHQVVLTTDVDAQGDGVMVPFLQDGRINLWDLAPVNLDDPDGAGSFVSHDQQWLVSFYIDGPSSTRRYDASGHQVGDAIFTTDSFARSWDGSLLAYATYPDPGPSKLMVMQTGQQEPEVELRTETDGSGTIKPVAISGAGGSCIDPDISTEGSCVVYYNVDGEHPEAFSSDAHGVIERLPVDWVADVSKEGWMAGRTVLTDDGSCSAMFDDRGEQLWETCEYTLGRFSPDGRYILGHPAYGDGIGDGYIAILDARTGAVLADYRPQQDEYVFINSAVWRDESTVATTVWDNDHWSVMQLDPGGGLATLIPKVKGATDDSTVPVYFEDQP